MSHRLVVLTMALFVAAPAAIARADTSTTVPIASGEQVQVTFTTAVGDQPAIAQAYVAYLDALPHGTELSRLRLKIASPTEVARLCGGREDEGILACYGPAQQEMIVPSAGLDATTEDGAYSVRYVLTHEYGHHIAANRNNREFPGGALDYGPKYWASYELVCDLALREKLFPGDEAANYRSNPGEGWSEAYARLVFPEQPWNFTPLLRPDAAALEAARRDVIQPWTANTSTTFTMAAGRRTQTFTLPLTLDGSLKATVRGPSGSEVGVRVKSGAQAVGRSKRKGAYDRWSLKAGCREEPVETLSFVVTRTGGSPGAVTTRVSYPG